MLSRNVFACVMVSAVFAAPAFAGPEWIEQGDAGPKVGSAQRTVGAGNLNSIAGSLSANPAFGNVGDFEDMFLITVSDPANFSMHIVNANFDAQLWMFNV